MTLVLNSRPQTRKTAIPYYTSDGLAMGLRDFETLE